MGKANLIRRGKFRESSNLSFERALSACGFPWPQRNYTCSFCNKQFKSAQALGGHMNVHRRERAKLRSVQPPLWDFANPNPNPLSSSSPVATFLPYQYSFPTPSLASFSSSPTSSVSKNEEKLQFDPLSLSDGVLKSLAAQEDKSRVLTTRGNTTVSLDLGMSLFRDAREELDLELRLGYSS